MFEAAAERRGPVPVTLDRPLDLHPGSLSSNYVQLAELVGRAAAGLHALGVGRGQRVAVIKRGHLDTLLLASACARIGAVPALIHEGVDREALPVMLQRLGDPLVLADAASLERHAGLPDLRYVLVGPGEGEALPMDQAAVPPLRRAAGEAVLITHTSGTTGVPKLAVHTVASLRAQSRPQTIFGRPFLRSDDTAAFCIAWNHARAAVGVAGIIATGLPLVAMTDASPVAAADVLRKTRPTLIEAHPNAFVGWEALERGPGLPLSQARVFFSTFDCLHPRTIRTLLCASRHRLALFVQVYGQTEIGPATMRFTFKRFLTGVRRTRTVGRSIPGFTRVRIVDPMTGAPLPTGRVGVIEVRSRGRMRTYEGQDELARGKCSGEWWSMEDIGKRSRSGVVYLLDRAVDRLPRIESVVELEDTLLTRLPELEEVVIVGGEDVLPTPVVCTRGDAVLSEAAWSRAVAGLPALQPPVQAPLAEIPMTPTLKVKRKELRRRLAEGAFGEPIGVGAER